MWRGNKWLQQTDVKSLFSAVDSTSPVTTSPSNRSWAQGQTTPHCCFCTNFLPVFPVVFGNWLAGFHWLWHLTFTVIRKIFIVGNWIWAFSSEEWNAATTWSGDKKQTINPTVCSDTHHRFSLWSIWQSCWHAEVYLAFLTSHHM